MILLSRFILKGSSQAALVAASMAVLGLVPLLGMLTVVLSGAAVALVTLTQGYRYGLQVILLAMFGTAVFGLLLFAQAWLALYFALAIWLPVWLCAVVLRQTVSLPLSVLLMAAMSLLALLLLRLLFPGIEEHWREPLAVLVTEIAAGSQGQLDVEELRVAAEVVIRLIPGLIASTLLLGTLVSLLLARWWQALNFNPGGFGSEFQALNLGRSAASIALLILVLTAWQQSDLLFAMSLVVLTLYILQGAAVMHAIVAKRRFGSLWLSLVYCLMLFVPHIMVALVITGLADTWFDFRRRLAA